MKSNKLTAAAIKPPVAGNYPQGLFMYPFTEGFTDIPQDYLQTLEWEPKAEKTFAASTQYTAKLIFTPAIPKLNLSAVKLEDIHNLPPNSSYDEINGSVQGENFVVIIKFKSTDGVNGPRKTIFEDNFDGITLNNNNWQLAWPEIRHNRSNWEDDMVEVKDGNLILKMRRDPAIAPAGVDESFKNNWIRAGAVRTIERDWPSQRNKHSLFENSYGYYEARIKFNQMRGAWGAFWLMLRTVAPGAPSGEFSSKKGTEIDIIEFIRNDQGLYNFAIHWDGYGPEHKWAGKELGKNNPEYINVYDGNFHTYALCWSPSAYIFYIDGVELWQVKDGETMNTDKGSYTVDVCQNPAYIKLSIESADYVGTLQDGWNEGEMLIDYVKVWNQPPN